MKNRPPQLYLPAADRSFWRAPDDHPSPLRYLAWGHRDFQAEHIPTATHIGWVVMLIEEGTPRIRIQDQPHTLLPGTLLCIGPDCPFGWESAPDSACSFLLWMWTGFRTSEEPHPSTSEVRKTRLPPAQWKTLQDIHRFCREEVQLGDSASPEALSGCQQLLRARIDRAFETLPPLSSGDRRCQQALAWMEAHLDSREPVARLCDYLQLSQSSLHRLFQKEQHTSPAAQFHQLKMTEADRRLRETDTSVKEIAFALGYEHFNDFSRAYKKHFGHTPSQSRQSGE